MKFWQLGVLFLVFFIVNLLIVFITPHFLPYLGFFPYKEIFVNVHLPSWLTSLANFDGVHYLLIAKNGYTTYEQAFFPLYPLLIKVFWPHALITNVSVGFFIALLISNLSFFAGLFFLNKYLTIQGIKSKWVTIFLLVFPTSFFFMAIYTEGLFFLFVVGTLYFLKRGNLLLTTTFAVLASLTRLVGVFLVIPIFLHQLQLFQKYNTNQFNKNIALIVTALSPLLGLGLYALYLWHSVRDPLFFLHSQWAFGAHRSSQIILLPQVYYRYIHIFVSANWNFQYLISLVEFVTFNLVFLVLIAQLFKIAKQNKKRDVKMFDTLGLNLFSLANLLLPTFTGTFSSIPRYALISLSFFIALSQMKKSQIKFALAFLFLVFHIIMLGFFVQGYFVS